MHTESLITVYVVNHNYGKYLRQALSSVIKQTYQNYELIVIDDGSTDNSRQVIEQFEKTHTIKVIWQKNKGLTASNNVALKLVKTKYIMRLDADDYLSTNALHDMVTKLESDSDLALVFPDYWEVDEEGNILHRIQRNNIEKEVSLLDIPAHGACTTIRTKILKEVGGYDEDFNRQDGFDLWLKVAHKYKVANINSPLFYYRQHTRSLTRNEKVLLETRAKIINKHVETRRLAPIKVFAIIPVRGSRLDARSMPLEDLMGCPLINWTINSALGCSDIDKVIVTTPDCEVLDNVNSSYGEKVLLHKRDSPLAQIDMGLEDTVVDVVSNLDPKLRPDAIVILNIDAPFRSKIYLTKAINVMQLFDVDAVVGVRLDQDVFYNHDGRGLTPRTKRETRFERDDLYRKCGGMTLLKYKFLEKGGTILGGRVGHIIIDQKSAFTIKTDFDWQIAKFLADF